MKEVLKSRLLQAATALAIGAAGAVATHVPAQPSAAGGRARELGGAFALQWIRSTKQLWAERADQQLYLAKQAGRNCIVLEEPPDSTVSAEEKNMLFAPLFTPSDWGELPPLDPPGSVN